MFVETVRKLLQVRLAVGKDLRRVEREQNAGGKRHGDPLAHTRDRGSRNVLLQLLGLLIHLVADDGTCCSTDYRADNCTTRRRAGLVANDSTHCGARRGADYRALRLLA